MNITGALVIALVVSTSISFLQYEHGKELKASLDRYEVQMSQLRADSKQQLKDAEEAFATAQNQMRQIQDESQKIIKEKVPNNCAQSMKWLAQQGTLI